MWIYAAGTYLSYFLEAVKERNVSWLLVLYGMFLTACAVVLPEEYRLYAILWAVLPVGIVSARAGNHARYGVGSAIVSMGSLGLAVASWSMLPAKISFGVLFAIINLTLVPTIVNWTGSMKQRVHVFMIIMMNAILVTVTVVLSSGSMVQQLFAGIVIYDTSKLLTLLMFMPGKEVTAATAKQASAFFSEATSPTMHSMLIGFALVGIGIAVSFVLSPLEAAVIILGTMTTVERSF